MKSSPLLVASCSLLMVAAAGAGGCGGGGGGAGASGGKSATGGKGGGGISTASGGATGSGGAVASGGSTGSGGSSATGGLGGRGGSGGSAGGGRAATGGASASTGGASGRPVGTGGDRTGSGGGGGMTGAVWNCPQGPFAAASNPIAAGTTAMRIVGVPPTTGADGAFNNNGNNFTNIEGPVWIDNALYVSEMTGASIPPSRILKIAIGDVVSVVVADSGSNGLAVDSAGNIVSANHKVGGLVRQPLPLGTVTSLITAYNGTRFNSPNDLTIRSDGTIYFTDPSFQNNARPQGATRVYRLSPGGADAVPVTDYASDPNGITLSIDERTLYVSGASGVKKYVVDSDGTVSSTGVPFGDISGSTDGMGIDCAGNLYVTVGNSPNVAVFSSSGTRIGQVTAPGVGAVTNVAFGGSDHMTLYITGYGGGKQQGAFRLPVGVPGKQY